MVSVGITGCGYYVPEKIIDNQWFEKFDQLPIDDVLKNSGVQQRRYVGDESGVEMESLALTRAAHDAGVEMSEIEFILDGPSIPDQVMPGNAAKLQHVSGAINATSINVETACTTLITQIILAKSLIESGAYKIVACVTSTNWSTVADYTDSVSMIQGDGAAAFIVQQVEDGFGILAIHLETEGSLSGAIGIDKRLPRSEEGDKDFYFYIDRNDAGINEVRTNGPIKTPAVAKKALQKAGLSIDDVDFMISHNPTMVLVDEWRAAMSLEKDQCHTTLHKYGNMSGASIGANLSEAKELGKLKRDDVVVMMAPGAGYQYAGLVMRWA